MRKRLQHYGLPPALATDPRRCYWGGAADAWEPSEAPLLGADAGPEAQQLAAYAGGAAAARAR
eukprot:5815319-Alexandrium_andersonii.AAC.1